MASLRSSSSLSAGVRGVALLCLLSACEQGAQPEGFESGDGGVTVALATQAVTALPVYANADTTLRSGVPYGNDGTGALLGVTSASVADIKRSIVRFDQGQIASRVPMDKVLHSARLELRVQGISAGWLGGAIDVLRMVEPWVEGTGLAGNGASWVCANDINTTFFGNLTNDCFGSDPWSMSPGGPIPQPFVATASDRAPIFTGGITTIALDVTADVQQFINGTATNHGWMIAGAPNLAGGLWVNFYARHNSNTTLRPQLIIDYGDDECPANPNKGLAGVCGCDLPDTDTNLDGAPDCFDATATATGDTTLRLAIPFGNDGTGTLLGTTSTSIVDLERTLVKVSTAAIETARAGRSISRAYLEMTVAGVAVGWLGGELQANRMLRSWVEGTGLAGNGASWFCANDTNTTPFGLPFNDCAIGDLWGQQLLDPFPRPFDPTPTSTVGVTWPPVQSVRFDVTQDVLRYLSDPAGTIYPNHGWLVQGASSTWIGGNWINFGSRETGAPPRLLLDLDPICPFGNDGDADGDGTLDCNDECDDDPDKTEAGQCGCNNPDLDPDSDEIATCIDPCPLDPDTELGGDCGCPSTTFEPEGTACVAGCAPSDGSNTTCDGLGHCGDPGDPAQCPPPIPSCPACEQIITTKDAYWYCPCATSGTAARQGCEDSPGQSLPIIYSDADNDVVRSLIGGDTWIGASDIGGEGAWRWSDDSSGVLFWEGDETGSRSSGLYENWAIGQPSDSAPNLDCGAISGTTGQWSSRDCTNNLNVLCVKSLESTPVPPRDRPFKLCERLGNCPVYDDPDECIDQTVVPVPFDGACPPGDDDGCPAADLARAQLEACDDCMANSPACEPGDSEAGCRAACDALCTGAANDPPPGGKPCTDLQDTVDPNVEVHCTLQTPLLNRPCTSHDDCDDLPPLLAHCGRSYHCRSDDDPTNLGVACAPHRPGFVLPQADQICTDPGEECVAQLFCGIPQEECMIEDVDPPLCVEYDVCLAAADDITPAEPSPAEIAELTTPTTFDPQDAFNMEQLPPVVPDFPEDGPCPDGTHNCSMAQGQAHPWCKYELDEQLASRAAEDSDKDGTAGPGGTLTFQFDPNLTLFYSMGNGPLGLPMPFVSAEASAMAFTEINIFGFQGQFDIFDIGLGAHAGISGTLRPGNGPTSGPNDLCGAKSSARAKILELDVLPADNDVNQAFPEEEIQTECIEAVQAFTEKVDRVRKAYADARELLRQYYILKDVFNANFSDGAGAALTLCEQIALTPPRDFPGPVFGIPCNAEPPEITIDRFIYYYNVTVRDALYAEAHELAAKLNSWGNSIDPIVIGGLDKSEEITIFNSTFLVGPVPVNLEVLMPVHYKFNLTIQPQFAIGDLALQLVFGGERSANVPFVQVRADGGPEAGAGIALFAGVGFDVGFASAKIGLEGAVSLGTIRVPANAYAGIGMSAEEDERPLPTFFEGLIDTTQPVLVPTQKLNFTLLYGYGAGIELWDVLSGELNARLKLKFFWFSVSYRKRIIRFNGFCTEDLYPVRDPDRKAWCDAVLFQSGPDDLWKWGQLELPVPFRPLKYLPVDTTRPMTASFGPAVVEKLFYDDLCQCLPDYDFLTVPKELCTRDADCCSGQCTLALLGPALGQMVCTEEFDVE